MADSSNRDGDSSGDRMAATDLAAAAKQAVEELTGYAPESISGVQWDGVEWLISVDVCELERVPNTTDVMATYVVQLDEQGRMLGYRRDRRFQRADAVER